MKIILFVLITGCCLISAPCHAVCIGYSWITELHAKRMGINCKSAQNQIDAVVESISQALISSRQVDLVNLGVFNVSKPNKARSNQKQISFKASKELSQQLNKDKNK